jgi:hypothetical protein
MLKVDRQAKLQRGAARRYFTLAEANRSLVLVRRVVADVVEHYARMYDLQEAIETAQGRGAYDRTEAAQRELVEAAKRLHSYAAELDRVGVDLKDWAAGIVDFPCLLDGREVCLSWRHGQTRIEQWHETGQDNSARHVTGEMFQDATATAPPGATK